MNILLTNDDGLRAPGIQALYEALADARGEFGGPLAGPDGLLYPIAPLTVQSATSHGVTFHTPLMTTTERLNWPGHRASHPALAREREMTGIAVDGRPADCVKLAVAALWPERFGPGSRPDLLISGMNAGANVGINVIYSGTVAAAIEAAFLGIPSIAVSLHMGRNPADFNAAAAHARRAIETILRGCAPAGTSAGTSAGTARPFGLPEPHSCLSINIPITELNSPAAAPGFRYPIRVCGMNTHGLNDKYERRTAPGGEVYYWASGHGLDFHTTDEGSDVQLIFQRSTTITPLRYDLTKKSTLGKWKERIEIQGAAGRL